MIVNIGINNNIFILFVTDHKNSYWSHTFKISINSKDEFSKNKNKVITHILTTYNYFLSEFSIIIVYISKWPIYIL